MWIAIFCIFMKLNFWSCVHMYLPIHNIRIERVHPYEWETWNIYAKRFAPGQKSLESSTIEPRFSKCPISYSNVNQNAQNSVWGMNHQSYMSFIILNRYSGRNATAWTVRIPAFTILTNLDNLPSTSIVISCHSFMLLSRKGNGTCRVSYKHGKFAVILKC